jgi:hypothetical protein
MRISEATGSCRLTPAIRQNFQHPSDCRKRSFDFAGSRLSFLTPESGDRSFSGKNQLFQLAVGTAAIAVIRFCFVEARNRSRKYLFVSLFSACCAESLASENASRLAAMQRAEKNIDELLEDLNRRFIVCAKLVLTKNCSM